MTDINAHTIWDALISTSNDTTVSPGVATLYTADTAITPPLPQIIVAATTTNADIEDNYVSLEQVKELLSYIHDTFENIRLDIEPEDHRFEVSDYEIICDGINTLTQQMREMQAVLTPLYMRIDQVTQEGQNE